LKEIFVPLPLPQKLQAYSDDLESMEPDEPETARALSETMLSIAYKTYGDSGHAMRSVHAKSHGVLKATLDVPGDLPAPLRQGLFSQAGRYDAVIRLSTTPGDLLHDSVSTPRGLALKILGVEGQRLPGEEATTSQDFLTVNDKQFNAPSAKAFLKNLKLLAATTDKAEWLKELASKLLRGAEKVVESVGGKSSTLVSLGGHPETHILGENFFAQLPLRYGVYVAKIAIVPRSPGLTALKGKELDLNTYPDGLRGAVNAYFRDNQAVWDVQVQLCTDAGEMSIEDSAAVWDERASPFITVATLTAPRQIAWDDERSGIDEDGLSFRPWNCLAAHRPLGSIMRMRKLAYARSAAFRSERNATPVREPDEPSIGGG
jgi:6,7-dimethyl-8-ribityllumazine synthase